MLSLPFTSTVLAGAAISYLIYKYISIKRNVSTTPLTISQINVYPVKSMRGMSVQEWEISDTGLLFDRSWMIVGKNYSTDTNAQYQTMTLRQLPRMWLIGAKIDIKNMVLTLYKVQDESDAFHLDTTEWNNDNRVTVDLFKRVFEASDMGDKVSEWLSKAIGKEGLRLVMTPKDLDREPVLLSQLTINHDRAGHSLKTSFTDVFPYLVTTENSLQDVIARKNESVTMTRFRPNITIGYNTALKPYEEEYWKEFQIVPNNESTKDQVVHMYNASVCARCTIPNINPDTAKREDKDGPSTFLRSYHKTVTELAVFGIHTIHSEQDIHKKIRVGDTIQVISKHSTIQENE
jgi:uncharacterized protein YcbX